MRLIDRRIVEAVRRAVQRGYVPKRFYLNEADFRAYAGRDAQPSPIDGIEIKLSAAADSKLYCQGGQAVFVPKDPSPKPNLERRAR